MLATEGVNGVRWRWTESEEAVIEALGNLDDDLEWEQTDLVYESGGDVLFLFDAACAGDEKEEYLAVELKPGWYSIATALYSHGDRLSLVLHKLGRVEGSH